MCTLQKRGHYIRQKVLRKKEIKREAVRRTIEENLALHGEEGYIHASLGLRKPVVTRKLKKGGNIDLKIQLYIPESEHLAEGLKGGNRLEKIVVKGIDNMNIPLVTSRRLLEQSDEYDIVAYMEDDILIEDREFFQKLSYIYNAIPQEYAVLPHRCELIENKGEVILSGDPDGGRPDLYWDTGERIKIGWPTGVKTLYRATNPHSGCYFLTKDRAQKVLSYWNERNWQSKFRLSGPLEQAASGLLLPVLKIMKPIPEEYRFLMVRHQDQLWVRHSFE